MALVNRESVGLLDDSWRVLGVYFLLGAADEADRYRAYVGEVGKSSLIARLRNHATKKEWWSRALVIASASDEFNSAEIGWLEGRLYDVLNNAVAAEVMNSVKPGDDSLAEHEWRVLEKYVEPIMACLRACGAPPDTADQKPEKVVRRKMRYPETLRDLVEAGLLKPETRLHPLRQGITTTGRVAPDGRIVIAGNLYDSPSAAAKAVTGTQSEAGWDFWGAPSGDGGFVPLAKLRERFREDRAANGTTKPVAAAAEPKARRRPPKERAGGPTKRYTEKLKDLIDAGLLAVGSELRPARKSVEAVAIVEADGQIRLGSTSYTSLSGAAKAAAGSVSEPGWNFWTVLEDGKAVSLFELRERLRPSRARES